MNQKLWTKNYTVGVFVLFGVSFISGIIITAIPLYVKQMTGQNTYVGIMTSVYTLAAFSMRIIAGRIAQRISAKKVIFVGVVLTLLGIALYIPNGNVAITITGRIIQGLGFGISQTAISTYIASSIPREHMIEGINYSALFNSLPSILAPSFAFLILGENYQNFVLLFIVSIILCVLVFLLMTFTGNVVVPHAEVEHQAAAKTFTYTAIILACGVLFINSVSQSAILSFASLYALDLGFAGVGSFFLINAAGVLITRFTVPHIVKRIGVFPQLLASSVLFLVTFILLAKITSFWQLLVLAFPAGFCVGSVTPIVNSFVVSELPREKSGLATGIYFSSMDFGYVVGGVLWGIVATNIGYSNMFLFVGLTQIIAILICIVYILRNRQQQKHITA